MEAVAVHEATHVPATIQIYEPTKKGVTVIVWGVGVYILGYKEGVSVMVCGLG